MEFRQWLNENFSLEDMTNKLFTILSKGRLTSKELEAALPEVNPEALRVFMNDLALRGHVTRRKKYNYAYGMQMLDSESFVVSRSNLKDIIHNTLFRMGLR